MDLAVDILANFPPLIVPMLALWAIVGLYSMPSGCHCGAAQVLYFSLLVLVSVITLRTISADDGHWLAHTSSLGIMVIAGVMRRPSAEPSPVDRESALAHFE